MKLVIPHFGSTIHRWKKSRALLIWARCLVSKCRQKRGGLRLVFTSTLPQITHHDFGWSWSPVYLSTNYILIVMLFLTDTRLPYTTLCLITIIPFTTCRTWRSTTIPGASRFSEKQRVWNGLHSASWGQLRSYWEENVVAPV
jgi:hypothetical protein